MFTQFSLFSFKYLLYAWVAYVEAHISCAEEKKMSKNQISFVLIYATIITSTRDVKIGMCQKLVSLTTRWRRHLDITTSTHDFNFQQQFRWQTQKSNSVYELTISLSLTIWNELDGDRQKNTSKASNIHSVYFFFGRLSITFTRSPTNNEAFFRYCVTLTYHI